MAQLVAVSIQVVETVVIAEVVQKPQVRAQLARMIALKLKFSHNPTISLHPLIVSEHAPAALQSPHVAGQYVVMTDVHAVLLQSLRDATQSMGAA